MKSKSKKHGNKQQFNADQNDVEEEKIPTLSPPQETAFANSRIASFILFLCIIPSWLKQLITIPSNSKKLGNQEIPTLSSRIASALIFICIPAWLKNQNDSFQSSSLTRRRRKKLSVDEMRRGSSKESSSSCLPGYELCLICGGIVSIGPPTINPGMETICGHFFHLGCIREIKQCPKCGRYLPPRY